MISAHFVRQFLFRVDISKSDVRHLPGLLLFGSSCNRRTFSCSNPHPPRKKHSFIEQRKSTNTKTFKPNIISLYDSKSYQEGRKNELSQAFFGQFNSNTMFPNFSYNVNKTTEKIVDLYDEYRQRYVGCETSSFVTANTPTKYSGKKKDRRKAIGRSPRRLSHLSQRRKLFSSSSLKEVCKATSKKTILVTGQAIFVEPRTYPYTHQEILTRLFLFDSSDVNKKSSQTDTKRALFLTAEEQKTRRLETLKRSPGKVRSLWMHKNLPKRSTPRKQTPKKLGQQTPKKTATPRKQATPGRHTPRKRTPRKMDEYRNLNENGKRNCSQMDSSDDSRSEASASLELSDTQRRVSL